MSKNNKFNLWWDSLPDHTKEYLNGQPIWHSKDMVVLGIAAFTIGCLFGTMFGVLI